MPFFIPNAFTPNGDGRNETFYDPGYVFNVSSVTMRIWNRWGQMVFTSDNMTHVWDGKDRCFRKRCPTRSLLLYTQSGTEFRSGE